MSAEFEFPDRLELPLRFDAALLQRDLETCGRTTTALWVKHFVKQNYSGDWSVLPLRCKKGATHPVQMIYADPTAKEFVDTPFLEACPYFKEVLASFKCELMAARLMKLTAGSVINPHTDLDLRFEGGQVRVHIPVATHPDVEFLLNGSRVMMDEGSVWYLRLSDTHQVANRGTTDRVHFVIDMKVNEWLKALFESVARVCPAVGAGPCGIVEKHGSGRTAGQTRATQYGGIA